ncbi:hypothetical protein M514_28243 [Trichuris suis]|uniref:Uncharacterized protein n=1 Tax=Trichuris suis TaxID=68888 RepID=A0A085MQT2_9BILA|nr:hypothetical protein M514_28243 [Trichuris suis]
MAVRFSWLLRSEKTYLFCLSHPGKDRPSLSFPSKCIVQLFLTDIITDMKICADRKPQDGTIRSGTDRVKVIFHPEFLSPTNHFA